MYKRQVHGRGGGHGEKGPAHAVAEKAGHIVDGAGSNSHTQVAVCGHVDEELTDGGLVKADAVSYTHLMQNQAALLPRFAFLSISQAAISGD